MKDIEDEVFNLKLTQTAQQVMLDNISLSLIRITEVLETITNIDKNNAVNSSKIQDNYNRILKLEDRNKWLTRAFMGSLIAIVLQFGYDTYKKNIIITEDNKKIIINNKLKKSDSKKFEKEKEELFLSP